MLSPFFWNVMSHQLVVGSWCGGPIFKGLNIQKNNVTHKPMKIKQLCHLKMSENYYPVTWNYISGQKSQRQQCKSQKSYTCKNMVMMKDIWGYTQQLHVEGNPKIWKLTKINISIFVLFSYRQHTFSDKMVLIKDKEVEHSCHEDW